MRDSLHCPSYSKKYSYLEDVIQSFATEILKWLESYKGQI